MRDIKKLKALDADELYTFAKDIQVRTSRPARPRKRTPPPPIAWTRLRPPPQSCASARPLAPPAPSPSPSPLLLTQAPYNLVKQTAELGRLPVVNFAAGGVATPADAAMMMQLGMDGVFVGSGIFKSDNPERRARAIVEAVANYNDPKVIARVSEDLGAPMVGLNCDDMKVRYAKREGGAMHDEPEAKKGKSPHGTW